jgi:hypothetical protein
MPVYASPSLPHSLSSMAAAASRNLQPTPRGLQFQPPTGPHRLEAQDTALSRRRQGFESPWGYFGYVNFLPPLVSAFDCEGLALGSEVRFYRIYLRVDVGTPTCQPIAKVASFLVLLTPGFGFLASRYVGRRARGRLSSRYWSNFQSPAPRALMGAVVT